MNNLRNSIYRFLGILNKMFGLRNNLVILCYHGIDDDQTWKYGVSEEEFKRQIECLLVNGYKPIDYLELQNFLLRKSNKTGKSFLITFDDGYKSIYTIKKFLKLKNIKPIFFPVSNPTNINRKELLNDKPLLNDDEISSLLTEGWHLGSHSMTHANLLQLTHQKQLQEIRDSKKILEHKFKTPVTCFAYPRGKYSKETLSVVNQSKYAMGYTMDDGIITTSTSPLQIPRIGVDRTHTKEIFPLIFLPLNVYFRKFIKSTPLSTYL